MTTPSPGARASFLLQQQEAELQHLRKILADTRGSLKRAEDERQKWGFHIMDSWQLFFDTGRSIGQISGDFKTEDVVKNDYVDVANSYDAAKVKADADGYALSDDYKGVDVEAIRAAL